MTSRNVRSIGIPKLVASFALGLVPNVFVPNDNVVYFFGNGIAYIKNQSAVPGHDHALRQASSFGRAGNIRIARRSRKGTTWVVVKGVLLARRDVPMKFNGRRIVVQTAKCHVRLFFNRQGARRTTTQRSSFAIFQRLFDRRIQFHNGTSGRLVGNALLSN